LIDLRIFFQFRLTFDSKNFISMDVSQSCMSKEFLVKKVCWQGKMIQIDGKYVESTEGLVKLYYLDCFQGLWRDCVNSGNFFVQVLREKIKRRMKVRNAVAAFEFEKTRRESSRYGLTFHTKIMSKFLRLNPTRSRLTRFTSAVRRATS
jgi:hypothetical protein